MKKTKLLICSVVALIGLIPQAQANFDVHDNRSREYVKITVINDRVRFEDCDSTRPNACTPIGKSVSYSLSELRSQKMWEVAKTWGAGASDVVLALGSLYGASMYFIGAGLAESATATAIAIGTTVAVPTVTGLMIDAVNPYEAFQKGQTLNEDVITDQAVEVSSIATFVKRLTYVLSHLDN